MTFNSRMAHAAFVRSPFPHAKIVCIVCQAACAQPGVIRMITGRELAVRVKPYVGTLEHMTEMKAAR